MTVRCSGDEISLLSATPRIGFSTEVEEAGPDEVEVRFESEDHESRFNGECDGGSIDPELIERDED